jgi:RHS repeat-associated protein
MMLTAGTQPGAIQEQYDYDAFGFPYFYTAGGGKLLSVPRTRFLFTGREWLSDLRIYDYRARQYQPELGRFLQPDPKQFDAGDYNLYRYCHNDPVNKSDPTGLDFTDPGLGQFVERMPVYLGTTSVTLKVVPVDQGNGTFKLRLDVKVIDRRVSETGANGVKRTKEQMDATCQHEEVEHSKDWRGFHDENQSHVPNTSYPNIDAAREAAKPIENKLWDKAEEAKKKFEEHKPDSRWKSILEHERK